MNEDGSVDTLVAAGCDQRSEAQAVLKEFLGDAEVEELLARGVTAVTVLDH